MTAQRDTLSRKLIRILAERISTGHYALGDRLPTEQEMIAEFGVSRTVVREAIANLKASGVVNTVQGSGAFVVQPDRPAAFQIEEQSDLSVAQEMIRILELRMALEAEAVVLAARRKNEAQLARMRDTLTTIRQALAAGDYSSTIGEAIGLVDVAFHRTISESTGNIHFLRLFNYLNEYLVSRSHMKDIKFGGGSVREYLERTLLEHTRIFEAIEQGDTDSARAALWVHLSGSRDRLKRRIDDISPHGVPIPGDNR